MNMRVLRTAVVEYDDGSEGVLELNVIDPGKTLDGPFLTVSSQDGDNSCVIGDKKQAEQLIKAIRAGVREIWDEDTTT